MDLGRISIIPFIVLPLASFNPSFNIYFITFLQVLFTDLGRLISNNDIVPLGIRYLFVGLFIRIGFISCQGKSSNTIPIIKIMQLDNIFNIIEEEYSG